MRPSRMSVEQRKKFCVAWPHALEALELIIISSPVWYVKVAVAILKAAGNTLHELICKTD